MFTRGNDLLLRLTDDLDPLFLFELELDNASFARLKAEQQLRIDFGGFAAKFSELVELACLKEEKLPRFIIKIDRVEPSRIAFKIAEVNEFKELDHLQLLFYAACDDKLKQFLSTTLLAARLEAKEQSNRLDFSRKNIEDLSRENAMLKEEMNRSRSELRQFKENSQKELERHLDMVREENKGNSSKLLEQLMQEKTRF